MKNYDKNSPKWFETTEQEIKQLQIKWCYQPVVFYRNLLIMRKYFSLDIEDFSIRQVPEKRNNTDSARLLCIKVNNKFMAKRHNNSNNLFIHYN